MKFLDHLDMSKTELRNAAIQVLASAPSSPVVGQIYFDSTSYQLLQWTGTAWTAKATDSTNLNGQASSYYLNRANQTGTQTASTISDLATVVKAYRLDEFAVPTNPVSFNSQRLTNIGSPTTDTDAVNRAYVLTQVQNAAAGIDSKASVRLLAASNITLSGTQTIDGVSGAAGDRILVTGQSTATQNGVYVMAAGTWARAADADENGEITPGAFWFVEEGGSYGKTQWRCNNTGSITLGTTSITIVQFGAASLYTASNGVQLVGTDFQAKVVGSGGLAINASGLYIDSSIVARKYASTIGDGSATSIVVTHNLGTKDVTVSFRDASSDAKVDTSWVATNNNAITVTFAAAPASNSIRVAITG